MSLVDYSELEQEIENAPEPKILKVGSEVLARIILVNTGVSEKNGCKWYNITFDVPEDPLVKEFRYFFWELDREHLDEKQYSRNLYSFKLLIKCFGIDISRPFNWEEDLLGKEGWVILGVKKDDGFGEQNQINKFVAGC